MKMKALGITVVSLSLTAAVIGNAYYQKKQFYPSVVYITKSNVSMAVIYLQAFIMVLLMGKLMRKVFFGQLRAAEFEHLVERSWYAITETCIAFTVFRDDFNPKFVAFFTLLLFLKSFHWLAEDRVDYMERSPVIGFLFHIRVQSLLVMLAGLDLLFIMHAYQSTIAKGASVQLVFGFEYAILIIMIVNISIKYVLHAVDSYWETPWENKAVVLLYTELIVGLLKVLLYLSFVFIMVRKYTLPLFAFRPMYYTMRSFKKAFNDVVLSRRAIRNMNTLYPDATDTELAAVDNVCIICREEMSSGAKKLPCNHIFHASCLRSWFQRQQTCPTCRLNILRGTGVANAAPPAHQPNVPNAADVPPQPPPQVPPHPANPANPANPMRPTVQPNIQPNVAQMLGGAIPNFTPLMGFSWPPPPMPPNLATLTPAELSRMEGRERQNIEARIQCLRNIQVMLDASVMMMQQYSAIAHRFPPMVDPKDATTQTSEMPKAQDEDKSNSEKKESNVTIDCSEPSTSKVDVLSADMPSTSEVAFMPVEKKSAPTEGGPVHMPVTDAVENNKGSSATNEATEPAADISPNSELVQNEDKDELRRRRVQKFNHEH